MRNSIIFYYGLDPEGLIKDKDNYRFYVDYQMYLLFNTLSDEKEINILYSYLSSFSNKYHKLIKNRSGSLISIIDNKKYILMKVTLPPNEEVDLEDMLKATVPIDNQLPLLNRNNWADLWSAKVDYLEYQVSELATDHPIIKSTFSYYAGLAENAIEYYNAIEKKNASLFLAQRRINYPNIAIDYYNPVTLVVDYRVREVSEYLKTCFFNSEINDETNDFFNKKTLFTDVEYNLIIARLLYPSYYFDDLKNVLENNEDESCLLKYINKTNEYEKFLKSCLKEFSLHSNIIKIDWLL